MLSLVLLLDVDVGGISESCKACTVSPLLKGFGVGEEGVLAGVVASWLSSRDVTKTEAGKITEPQ